jgi:AcrR family transcriptional regulator
MATQMRARAGAAAARRRKRAGTYHHGDLRAAAVAAARDALDRGQQLPTLRELAAACGVSHPSLYRHFGNAEDLMLSVAAACFLQFDAHIRAASRRQRAPLARLRAGCEASIRWGVAHPERYALMTGPELSGKQHHAEFFAAARTTFDGLNAAVAACGVRAPIGAAHTILCALHGLTDYLRKGRTIPHAAESVDQQIRSMCAMVLTYVESLQAKPY